MNFKKSKKYTLIALSDIGSILAYVISAKDRCLLTPGTHTFHIHSIEEWKKEYLCSFVPDPSYQSLNKGKFSKRQRRSL